MPWKQQPLGLEFQPRKLAREVRRKRVDVVGISVIGWQRSNRRLPAHPSERAEDRIIRSGCRCCAILRIERCGEDPSATIGDHIVERGCNPGMAVAHCIMDAEIRQTRAQRFRLAVGDDAQWRALVGPDLVVRLGRLLRPRPQHHAMKDRLPRKLRNLDHPRVAQELGEIAPHRPRFRRVGRPKVDQQHADLLVRDARMVGRPAHATAIGSNGSERIRLPVAA